MTLSESTETVDEINKNNLAQSAAELDIPRPDKRVSPGLDPVSLGRRLDVDAVLERSVRKVVTD